MFSSALSSSRRIFLLLLLLLAVCVDLSSSQSLPRPSIIGSTFALENSVYNLKCTHLNERAGVTLSWQGPSGVTLSPPTETRSEPSPGIFLVESLISGQAIRAINVGVFKCTASLDGTTSSDSYRLRVQVKPSAPVIVGPSTIGAGVEGRWTCSSNRGEPQPLLRFLRGNATYTGDAFTTGTSQQILLNRDDNTINTTLQLNYAPTPADLNLVLVCQVTQDFVQGSQTTRLPVFVQLKPTVTVPPSPLTFREGEQSTISCIVLANPAVTSITWFKDGAALDVSGSDFRFGTSAEPSLTFVAVAVKDEGSYACSATNSEGQTNSSQVAVNVVYTPKVTVTQTTIDADLGQTVTITCNVDARPAATSVTWFQTANGVTSPVDVTGKFSGGTTSNPSLVISSLSEAEAGTYRCTADNSVGRGQSSEVNVTAIYAPRGITVNATSVSVDRGSDVTLVCSADASPTPSYSWTLRGQEVGTAAILSLTNVTAAASGNYTCRARNNRGELTSVVVLDVLYPPTINRTTAAVGTSSGETLTIPCPVSANPPPTNVTWTRDDVKVDVTQPGYSGGTLSTPDLTIASLSPSDHGVYRCLVTSARGSAVSDPVNVTISYAPTNVQTVPLNSTTVLEGSNVTLSCSAEAVPSPVLSWTRGDAVVSGYASFTLYSVARANSGLYTCRASNREGIGTASVFVDVQYEPRVTSAAGGVVSGRRGTVVTLPCAFEANPPANRIAWYRSGTAVDLSQARYSGGTLATPSLTITNFQPADVGSYVCNVTNTVGVGYVTISTIVTYPPTGIAVTPASIAVMELSPFSATCSADASPAANFTWLRGGAIFQDGATLSVNSARPEHDAAFTCLAANSEGNATAQLRVNVSYAPIVTTNQSHYGGDLYQSVTIPCHVSSNPPPLSLSWKRLQDSSVTEVDVAGSGGKYTGGTLNNPDLTIHNLTSSDVGRYRCDVTNSVGTSQSPTVNVSVTYPPNSVSVTGPSSTVLEGTSISLGCQANGYPPPTLRWYRGGSGVPIATGPTLRLNATAQDNTNFRCVATNVKGSHSGEYNVSVSFKPVPAVTPPSNNVGIGGTVTLDCNVRANPPAEVDGYTWYFRGTALPGITARYLVVNVSNSSFYGVYSCTARNGVGTSDPINMTVAPETTTPATGASTESSLSTTTIIIIVLVVILLLAIIVLVIFLCYMKGLCSKIFGKKKKGRGRVHPEEGRREEELERAETASRTRSALPYADSSILSKKDVNLSVPANGHVANGKPQPISSEKRIEEDDPSRNDDVGGGPIIALNDEEGQKPHHLPPLKYATDVPQPESPQKPKKKKRKKKKSRPAGGQEEGEEGERLVEGQGSPGESTPPGSGKPPLPPPAGPRETTSVTISNGGVSEA